MQKSRAKKDMQMVDIKTSSAAPTSPNLKAGAARANSVNKINFTFSDTVAGYVTNFDSGSDSYTVKTAGDQEFTIKLMSNTYAQFTRNLGDPWQDCTGQMRQMLTEGRYVFTYGVFYPEGDGFSVEAQFLMFPGRKVGEYGFERQDWWVKQVASIADFYLKAQFGTGPVDYKNYRTTIQLSGQKETDNYRQETDTISRLVYGFASAYLLTGDDRYLEGAEKGTEYLREHMRFYDMDENIIYWYHGIDVHGSREDKVFSSEFGDDFVGDFLFVRRVGKPPVELLDAAGKNGAGVPHVVADGDDDVEVLPAEFVEVFGAMVRDVDADFVHHLDGDRVDG